MKYNKVYLQKDALSRHEDFDTWYEDGDVFLRFESKQGWSREKDKVQIMGRMGGQVGLIKPDNNTLNYFIQYERYEYTLHTYVLYEHYYIEGMVWDLYGSFKNPPFNIVEETLTSFDHKAVHVRLVKNFRDKGECYEIHVPQIEKLRIGVACVVAIGIKEEWEGLSEGEEWESANLLERLRGRIFENKGYTYEQIRDMKTIEDPRVQIIKPQGRPIDRVDSHYKGK